MTARSTKAHGAVVFGCRDLDACLPFFERLGFRLDRIFPADAPRTACMSGFGLRLQLERSERDGGGHLRLPGSGGALTAPNGVRVEFAGTAAAPQRFAAATFVASRAGDAPWHEGRAGMLYRDLIPGRQGGALIGSHIRIDRGGPVPDYVHYHLVTAQVIYCRAGQVRVVYEDQGEPFVLRAGDCVLQPPAIRHRVLECSAGLEVVELSAPAEHETCVDHELALPTMSVRPERTFAGQHFVWHRAEGARWQLGWPDLTREGFRARDTGITAATAGALDVRVVQATAAGAEGACEAPGSARFWFVLRGSLELTREGAQHVLRTNDACLLPPRAPFAFCRATADLELLEACFAAP